MPPANQWKRPKKRAITGMGDVAAIIAQPIAAASDAVFRTQLKTCDACQQRRREWNHKFPFP